MIPLLEVQYESLRNRWRGETAQVTGRPGMALLLRDGMASWMQAWRDRAGPESRIERALGNPTPDPCGDPDELVMALANMALSAGKEIGA